MNEAIGADSARATGNFALVLTEELGQTSRFVPVLSIFEVKVQ